MPQEILGPKILMTPTLKFKRNRNRLWGKLLEQDSDFTNKNLVVLALLRMGAASASAVKYICFFVCEGALVTGGRGTAAAAAPCTIAVWHTAASQQTAS
jgi:hypothetical protein